MFLNVSLIIICFSFKDKDTELRESTVKVPVKVKVIPTPPRRYFVDVFHFTFREV